MIIVRPMSTEAQPRSEPGERRSFFPRWYKILGAAVCLYVLSFGPVFGLTVVVSGTRGSEGNIL